MKETFISPTPELYEILDSHGSTRTATGIPLADLVKRPELSYDILAPVDKNRPALPQYMRELAETDVRYEGYIRRQQLQVEQFKKAESKKLPEDFDYSKIEGLRVEAREKLNLHKPLNIGQAGRISGVSPADISVLMIYFKMI